MKKNNVIKGNFSKTARVKRQLKKAAKPALDLKYLIAPITIFIGFLTVILVAYFTAPN